MITYTLTALLILAGLGAMAFLAKPADDWNDKHIS
jgi:hypothetical protein